MNEDKSSRYHRSRRRLSLLGAAWRAAFLVLLVSTGWSAALRDGTVPVVWTMLGTESVPVVAALFAGALVLLHEIVALPLAFYGGYLLERRYGLSTQHAGEWFRDQGKGLVLGGALAMAAAALLYGIVGWFPRSWWLVAGAVFTLLTAGLAALGPVVFLPVFYPVRRLERESLSRRLLALAERAGANVAGVYEWSVSTKTRKANAALAGLGATRRILVSDTMLASYSEDEVEVVLAHELGHHVHGDIWKGLLLQSATIVCGFAAAGWTLAAHGGPLGVAGPADVAGLPIVVLAFGAVTVGVRPWQLAFSRACERDADRFALTMTGNPAAFISAMRRLSAQNLAEAHPSRIVQWLFHSHPPIEERVAAARTFRVGRPGESIAAVSR